MLIAFISDIHSNLEALKAVLNRINSLKIKQVFCLGDLVGYGASPKEVIKLMEKIPCIKGNHDYAVVSGDTSWFNPLAAQAILKNKEMLSKNEIKFLDSLKEKIEVSFNNKRFLLVHGSPKNPVWEYVYESQVNEYFFGEYDVIIMGHTHVPFIKKIKEKIAINCGSVGQPRDYDKRACFIIFDTEEFKGKIVRVEYEIEKVAKKIIRAGLPEFLAERLFLGI